MSLNPTPSIRSAARLFLLAYILACALFWWLPDLLLWAATGIPTRLNNWTIWVSIASLLVFVVGYLFPQPAMRAPLVTVDLLDTCEEYLYKGTVIWAVPAFACALQFGLYRWGFAYGEGSGIPFLYQAVLYVHLFLGFTSLSVVSDKPESRRRIGVVSIVTILPRLFISLHWGRFYVAQAVVPIILIALARGWIRPTRKRILQLAVLGLAVILVPAITRGDRVLGTTSSGQSAFLNFLKAGNTLEFLQDNQRVPWHCPPLLVSLTEKMIPYSTLDVCTVDVGSAKRVPAGIDVLLTRQYSDDLLLGSGGNYLLELYVTGGIPAIVIGTFLFAASCRRFIEWIGHRSLFAGIWAECLSRALFAPRGTLGYVYERIPSLIVATILAAVICKSSAILQYSDPRIAAETDHP